MVAAHRIVYSFDVNQSRRLGATRGFVALLAGVLACATVAGAQSTDSLPFACGERLTFLIHTRKFGNVGHAVMSLSGPVDVRGTPTMVASLDASAGIAFLQGRDVSHSWFDASRMTSLRFEKSEKRPFSSARDSVEIYPSLRHWEGAKGDSGSTASSLPLDELSFLYYLRTVSLVPDSVYSFDRHYDKRRLPTTVRMMKEDTLKTAIGEVRTIEYEMKFVDARDYTTQSILHIWIGRDRCRLPLRIESVMPFLGDGIMTLQTAESPNCQYPVSK